MFLIQLGVHVHARGAYMFALGSAWLWLLHELQRRTESLLGRQQTAQCLSKCECTCLTAAKIFKPRPKSMVGSTFKRQRHHPREPRPRGPTCGPRRTRPRRGNPACSTGSRSPSATASQRGSCPCSAAATHCAFSPHAMILQQIVRYSRLPAFSTHAHAVHRTVAAGVDGPRWPVSQTPSKLR
jgi:hypothetical protein